MGSRTDTRDRMVAGAATLLAEQGVPGTTVAAVLARTGTPRGSVGHHFPGGRAEMLTAALRMVGTGVTDRLRAAVVREQPPAEIIDVFCDVYRDRLLTTGFTAGCPVWAVVQDCTDHPDLAEVATAVIDEWTDLLAESLVPLGYAPASARETASFLISSVEGAVALSRLRRSPAPLDAAADVTRRIVSTGQVW